MKNRDPIQVKFIRHNGHFCSKQGEGTFTKIFDTIDQLAKYCVGSRFYVAIDKIDLTREQHRVFVNKYRYLLNRTLGADSIVQELKKLLDN